MRKRLIGAPKCALSRFARIQERYGVHHQSGVTVLNQKLLCIASEAIADVMPPTFLNQFNGQRIYHSVSILNRPVWSTNGACFYFLGSARDVLGSNNFDHGIALTTESHLLCLRRASHESISTERSVHPQSIINVFNEKLL